MTNLLDDLNIVTMGAVWSDNDHEAKARLVAFIKAHQPWYPPQPEGFGSWIEYKEGDKGPCVGDEVHCLLRHERERKRYKKEPKISSYWDWSIEDVDEDIVAYCVKETP